MSDFGTIDAFVARSRTITDITALHTLIGDITRDMGFDYFSVTQMDLARPAGERAVIGISNYPRAWIEEMVRRNLVPADPTLQAGRLSATGFRWDEVDRLIRVEAAHRDMMARARRGGLGDGFSVPANVSGELPALTSFAVRPGRTLPEQRLIIAQLAGTFAYDAARRLHLANPGALAPVRLTPRQLDVTLHIARGKTDWEIARILGLSEETVTEHVNAARVKYGVARRSQLVLRAIQDGHFSIADALGGTAARTRTLAA